MRQLDTTGQVMIGAAIATTTAALFLSVLVAIARPAKISVRLRGDEAQASALIDQMHEPRPDLNIGPGDVCPAAVAFDAGRFSASLRTAAAHSGVTITRQEIGAGASDHAGALTPAAVAFDASGPQGAVTRFLSELSQLRPAVFLDRADLKLQGPSVALSLSGNVFCSTKVDR